MPNAARPSHTAQPPHTSVTTPGLFPTDTLTHSLLWRSYPVANFHRQFSTTYRVRITHRGPHIHPAPPPLCNPRTLATHLCTTIFSPLHSHNVRLCLVFFRFHRENGRRQEYTTMIRDKRGPKPSKRRYSSKIKLPLSFDMKMYYSIGVTCENHLDFQTDRWLSFFFH